MPVTTAARVAPIPPAPLRAHRDSAAPFLILLVDAHAGGAAAPSIDGRAVAGAVVRVGDTWALTFAGSTANVVASKGIADIAALLAAPERDVHCTELIGAAVHQPDTGDVIDATARRRYEARIVELHDDIGEAETNRDLMRATAARAELDTLVDHLTAALSLGGRSRTAGSTTERARSAVTHRIRNAITRIGAAHPPLGRHLGRSICTGLYCSYRPDRPMAWHIDAR